MAQFSASTDLRILDGERDLPRLVVASFRDAAGNPVANAPLAWEVFEIGSFDDDRVTTRREDRTDEAGEASQAWWELPVQRPRPNITSRVTVTIESDSQVEITIASRRDFSMSYFANR